MITNHRSLPPERGMKMTMMTVSTNSMMHSGHRAKAAAKALQDAYVKLSGGRQCAECRRPIRAGQRIIAYRGEAYHETCAGYSGR